MRNWIEEKWQKLAQKYSDDSQKINTWFEQLNRLYEDENRFYHNWEHISMMLRRFDELRNSVKCDDCVYFAVFFHDAIYQSFRHDNELRSARLARTCLSDLGVPTQTTQKVRLMIKLTQNHTQINGFADFDNHLFLDLDLETLGLPPEKYMYYTRKIRREYAQVPEIVYKQSRKKVLQNFLKAPKIYKTPYFFEHFEAQARKNIKNEISLL